MSSAHGAADSLPEAIPGYRVRLEHYYGPLDLLLHLVQQHELDILQIPIAAIADQYLEYVRALKAHDIDLSGEFLSMASYLMVLKSRALVPPQEAEGPQEEEEPAGSLADLIRRLLEFRRVKDRAAELAARWEDMARRAPRPELDGTPAPRGLEIPRDVEVWDLVIAYARLAERVSLRVAMTILFADVPIEQFMEAIRHALERAEAVGFDQLVGDRADRGHVIGAFLALLELMRSQEVTAQQVEPGGRIVLRRRAGDGRGAGI